MSVNYAEKYSAKVDERFRLGALTQALVNQNYDWIGVSTVQVQSIPTVDLNDYELTGSNRYGAATDLQNSLQELTVSQDKAFTFTIDRKSEQDTMGAMEAGSALAREIEEVIIPAVDMYRINVLCTNAPAENAVNGTPSKTNAYSLFLDAQEILDNKKAPVGGRVALVSPSFYKFIKQDADFIKQGDLSQATVFNGQVGEIDGVPVIKAPQSYFPEGVHFVITNAECMPAPIKLQDYIVHENPVGVNGWVVEGRLRHDAFVLNNKADAIAVCKTVSD